MAAALNTETKGVPIVVFNPLNIAREDVVEANVDFLGSMPKAVRVIAPDGKEVPAQISDGKVIFVAKVPSVGYAVYDVQSGDGEPATAPSLHVSENSLENQYYRVTLNSDGDVASIFDKSIGKELLAAPARLAISYDNPEHWPAWNMDWDQEQAAPKAYVGGPAKIRVVENGAGARGGGSFARDCGLAICSDHPPVGGRRRKARGVRKRDRLEYQGIESEGDFPADGFERDGYL